MTSIYKIADKNIEITSLYADVHTLCAGYESVGVPDFSVETSQSDIDFERERSASEDVAAGRKIACFSDGYLETLAVYRKIADKMLEYNTLLFHGSAIMVDGTAYLFTAKSGTGKSTHTRLWREYFGERAVMVNDDKPLIKIAENGVFVYGTPWNGKHRLGNNICAPLKAICVLERGAVNRIEKAQKRALYPILLQQTHRPQNPNLIPPMLKLLDILTRNVGFYHLWCNMDIEAAKVAYEGMNKE